MSDTMHHIGEFYRYPNDRDKIMLTEVTGFIYRFSCGHWCTDTVFVDLIRCKTGIQVCDEVQLELFTGKI